MTTRELTVRIRFTTPSLGNQKLEGGKFIFSRGPGPNAQIIFLSTWHQSNMRMAAKLLNRHQDEVSKIFWDVNVDGVLDKKRWYKNFSAPAAGGKKQRYTLHEAFHPGDVIGINCAVPTVITDDDLWSLMSKAGQYRGLSPWKPGELGYFEVISVRTRANSQAQPEEAEPGVRTEVLNDVKC